MIYNLILPIDKFSGVVLDSLNLPAINFKKVGLMCTINLVFDIIVIIYFKSVVSIAYVSILTFTFGTLYSLYMVKKHLMLSVRKEALKRLRYLFIRLVSFYEI